MTWRVVVRTKRWWHPASLLAKLVDAEGETDGVMAENGL